MSIDILDTDAYLLISRLMQDEAQEAFSELVACRDADQKTFLQGKIEGLSFLERFEDDVAIDIEEAKDD